MLRKQYFLNYNKKEKRMPLSRIKFQPGMRQMGISPVVFNIILYVSKIYQKASKTHFE